MSTNETKLNQPRDLFVLPLPRLDLQTLLVHLVHIACRLHVVQYVILEIGDGLEWVGHILIILDISDNIGGFDALRKIDKVCAFDDRGNAVFNEGQVGEVNT